MMRYTMNNVETYEMIKQELEPLLERFKQLENEVKRVSSAITASELIDHNHRIGNIEKQLSTCIDVKLLYSDRQARETWQNGVDVMIETLHKKISDLDFMFKQMFLCVDNSHVDASKQYLGVAPVGELNQMAKEEFKGDSGTFHLIKMVDSKVHHPSRKHLETNCVKKIIELKNLKTSWSDLKL